MFGTHKKIWPDFCKFEMLEQRLEILKVIG